MTEVPINLPPARERNRGGVRYLDWLRPPEAQEAFVDKLAISLRGSVLAPSEEALRDYTALLNPGGGFGALDEGRVLFGAGHWQGDKFVQPVIGGTSVSDGSLELYRGRNLPGSARIVLGLKLNPTRTLSHLLERFGREDFADLRPAEFFRLAPRVAAHGVTLDGRDNMLSDFQEIGGTAFLGRVRHLNTFLREYEEALQRLLAAHLCPVEQGYRYSSDGGGDLVARNGVYEVRLQWGGLSLRQCEVLWERQTDHALAFVNQLAKQCFAAARAVTAHSYDRADRPTLERSGGSLSLLLPLTPGRSIMLAIYAKALDRVRFEVRYLSDLPQDIRTAASPSLTRLTELINAARDDAVARLRWEDMGRLMSRREPDRLATWVDLADAVRIATAGRPELFSAVLATLLQSGGLTDQGQDGAIPTSIIRALERSGVLERVRLLRA